MDDARAKRFTDELIDRTLGDWTIERRLGSGKSAVVFAGIRGAVRAAVKVFDPELVERFGPDQQSERITREKELGQHDHPNLINILDGGRCNSTGYFYLVMDLIDWPSLDQVLSEVPKDKIWPLIQGIASAAQFLHEDKGLVHRDIKPSNIVTKPDFSQAQLLDLGVIRPLGGSDITDHGDNRPFIGTLRYSPPEFLFREEQDTPDGWKAVTFYQLGGVLHDLIVGRPLFEEFSTPYAKLVRAVTEEIPVISASGVAPELVMLARNCLTKDPNMRLRLVSWESFSRTQEQVEHAVEVKQRLRQRKLTMGSEVVGRADEDPREARKRLRKVTELIGEMEGLLRRGAVSSDLLPPAFFALTHTPENDNAVLLVAFQPDGAVLRVGLNIFFAIDILNPEERVVSVFFGAAVGPKPSGEQYAVGFPRIRLFEGVLEPDILLDRLYASPSRNWLRSLA